jgi:hypothetical protein
MDKTTPTTPHREFAIASPRLGMASYTSDIDTSTLCRCVAWPSHLLAIANSILRITLIEVGDYFYAAMYDDW